VIGIRHGWAGFGGDGARQKLRQLRQFFAFDGRDRDRAGTDRRNISAFLTNESGTSEQIRRAAHLKDKFNAEKNDLTPEVLKNLEWLGINTLVPIGGDDTLSYGVRLHKRGIQSHRDSQDDG